MFRVMSSKHLMVVLLGALALLTNAGCGTARLPGQAAQPVACADASRELPMTVKLRPLRTDDALRTR